jgi:murein DD-endopeptidase MepM/ murein hydrolase activator NlpD
MRSASLLCSFDGRRRPKRARTVTIGRRTLVVATASLVLLTGWSGASLLYFISRDDLALIFLEKQAALKRSYDEKIKALTGQIDRTAGERTASHQALEARVGELLKRQEAFERRQAIVQRLASGAGRNEPDPLGAGDASSVQVTSPSSPHAYAPEPKPASNDIFELRLRKPEPGNPDRTSEVRPLEERLRQIESNLAAFETRQVALLKTLIQEAEAETVQLKSAIWTVGLDPATVSRAAAHAGGPLVPVEGGSGLFEALANHAQATVGRLQTLRRSVAALPFGEPIQGEIDLSSGFGYRLDPFTRSPALHTGLDFKAEYGAPVRATGTGRVVAADYAGAYGNMVEIDHGNGVTSRYAHLATIGVLVGQDVQAGTALGRVGSTGRSTGPHLHYETRISGEAVNPSRFLKAGAQITPLVIASR